MIRNMGTTDRVVRLVVAGFMAFMALTPFVAPWFMMVLLAAAAVLAVTAALGHCPLYRLIDLDSRDRDEGDANPYAHH